MFICVWVLPLYFLNAQVTKVKEAHVSVFNNATALPFSGKLGIFHAPLHPGIAAGMTSQLNKNPKHNLLLSARFAYLYQQYVQHAVQFYPELGYRYVFKNGIKVGPKLGIGYLHAFTDLQQFKLNDQGEYYRMKNRGTPSLMASFSIELGYDLQKTTSMPAMVFAQYQLWFQTPFVKSYVPVLPNTALHLGLSFNINKKE
ncbi:MAG TPA: hypothetical protein VK921_06280 [Anditalea sp.]|nr:hypothetical protein [Anditalea sp.]